MTRKHFLTLAVAVAVAMVGGCTQGEMPDGSKPSVNGSKPDAVVVTEAVLVDYMNAMNSLDVAEAMNLRCKDFQVSEGQFELFKKQTQQLLETSGPLELADVKNASGLTGVDGQVSFALKGHDGQLVTSTVKEGSRDVLCHSRPAASYDIQRQVDGKVVDLGPTATATAALIPDSVGEGFKSVPPAVRQPTESQVGELIDRAWQNEHFGGVTVTVAKYPSEAKALKRAEQLVDEVVPDSVATVKLDAAPQAVAVQFLGFAWIFVQSPSVPPYVVRAVLPFGETVVTVQVSGAESVELIYTLNSVVADIVHRAA